MTTMTMLFRTGMPPILRKALLARSTVDISSSSVASSKMPTGQLGKDRLEQFEKTQEARTSLGDLSLEEAAEVITITIIILLIIISRSVRLINSVLRFIFIATSWP